MSDGYKDRTSLKRNKQLLKERNSGSRRKLRSLACTKTPPSVSSSAARSATGSRALSGVDLVGGTTQHQSARPGCKKGGLGRALQAKILQHCTEAARPHIPLALLEMCPGPGSSGACKCPGRTDLLRRPPRFATARSPPDSKTSAFELRPSSQTSESGKRANCCWRKTTSGLRGRREWRGTGGKPDAVLQTEGQLHRTGVGRSVGGARKER